MSEQIIILGSGPAGLTAAIYASRAGLSPIVLSGNLPGGLLTQTSTVENFPGFPEFIEGFDLMERMKAQAKKLGAKLLFKNATAVELSQDGGPHVVRFASGEPLSSRALIIATGSRPRELGGPGEAELRNRGVSYCATCDGPLYRGKDVVVVGGGDTALEEALYLAGLAKSVTLVHRRDAFRASQAMVDRVLSSSIHISWNSTVHEIHDPAAGRVTSVTLRNTQDGSLTDLPCDAVFLAVGHLPDTALFAGQLNLEPDGSIHLANPPSTATSVPGVFAAGDCADPVYRQAINAAAAGCRAAMDASRWLQSLPLSPTKKEESTMATQIQHLDLENFEDFLKKGTVLVDFWAPWCGPCRMQGQILAELAEEENFHGNIGKVNVDEARDIAVKYNIMSIPTLIVFKNGEPDKVLVGLQDSEVVKDALK